MPFLNSHSSTETRFWMPVVLFLLHHRIFCISLWELTVSSLAGRERRQMLSLIPKRACYTRWDYSEIMLRKSSSTFENNKRFMLRFPKVLVSYENLAEVLVPLKNSAAHCKKSPGNTTACYISCPYSRHSKNWCDLRRYLIKLVKCDSTL